MFRAKDVIRFYNPEAGRNGKVKFHLCIGIGGYFFFINSPKPQKYPTDFVFECSELPFIVPTESGNSIVSCSKLLKIPNDELNRLNAKKIGEIGDGLMSKLARFVMTSPVLTEEQREEILEAMGDWL